MGAKTRRTIGMGVLALVSMAGGSACSEDETGSEPPLDVSAYQEEVEGACALIDRALAIESASDSDAEWVSDLRADTIPEIRSLIRRLNRLGFPPDRAQEYREAYSDALVALSEVDDEQEAYRYLDRSRRGFGPGEDYLTAVREAFVEADVPCD